MAMEEKQNANQIDKAYADFLAEIEKIRAEQKKLEERVRLLLEKVQVRKVLEKIVSIK